jgi:hypothetical protein
LTVSVTPTGYSQEAIKKTFKVLGLSPLPVSPFTYDTGLNFNLWKGTVMKLIFAARLILILFFILPFDAVQHHASTLYSDETGPQAYAERHLGFKNWMGSSSTKREMLVDGYLRLVKNAGPAQIAAGDQQRAREIIANATAENLIPYINKTYTHSKKALRATGGGIEVIIHQYVQKRLETEKNYRDLLEIAKIVSKVKDADSDKDSGPESNNRAAGVAAHQKISDTAKQHFSFEGWQRQTHDEKIILVSGYVAFLKILIKDDFCLDDEERRRFDLYCKLVTVKELVDHVDRLYEDPLYREDGAQILIYRYMTYNFQNYIGDPLAYRG